MNRRGAVLLVVLALALATPPAWAQYKDHPLEAPGLPPSHGYFSGLPWEQIDMLSGNVVLSFTVVDLPGNNGMDLKVVWTYNSKGGWQLRFGPQLIAPTELIGASVPWLPYPTILTMDGGKTPTFAVTDENGSLFRSTTHWLVNRDARSLSLPTGVVYQFDTDGRMTEARDPYSNRITAAYAGTTTTLVQYLNGGAAQRTVVLVAGPTGTTVTYNGREWHWTLGSDGRTTTYQPPTGTAWSFVKTPGSIGSELGSDACYPGVFSTLTVTTPAGGTVAYDFRRCVSGRQNRDPENPRFSTRISERRTGGRGVTPGVWTFWYSEEGLSSEVQTPNGRIEYEHGLFGLSSYWLGSRRVYAPASAGGALLEETAIDWWERQQNEGPAFVGELDMHPEMQDDLVRADPYPLLARAVTTTRGNAVQRTEFEYQSIQYNDYGHPWRVRESGSFDRMTEFLYHYGGFGSHYILGKVAGVRISDGSGSPVSVDSYWYDATGFLTQKCLCGVCTGYAPSEHGDVHSETDGNNHTTAYASYEWGVPAQISAPAHRVDRAVNPDGTIGWERRDGYTRVFSYDDLGRETNRGLNGWNTDTRLNNDASTWYEPDGSFVKASRGRSWTKTFLDGFGRPAGTENAVGVKTTVEYDAAGNRSYESYPYSGSSNVGTHVTYDALGRVVGRMNPDGSSVTYAYDGLQATITDEKGRTTVQQWEATGTPDRSWLRSVTDAKGHVTTYAHDLLGSLVRVEHPNGTTRTWSYDDSRHWLVAETHPESGTVSYGYDGDAVGNVRSRTDANGVVLNYTYDGDNRLTDITVGSGGTPDDIHFAYDGFGNRFLVENAYVSRVFTFEADRPVTTTDWIRPSGAGAWSSPFVTTYAHDGNDNLESVRYPSGPQRTLKYDYDAANRVEKVYEDGGPTYAEAFSYHPSGAISGFTSGNGIINTVSYDDSHQRSWPHAITAGSALSLTYGYDIVGNVESITGAASGAQTFTYDALDRLWTATGPWHVPAIPSADTYEYDAVGNRISKTGPSGATTYSHTGNRLLSAGGLEPETLTYDDAGNLTGDAAGRYTYTPFDMLATAAMYTGVTPTYRYDGDHLRTITTISGVDRIFLHGLGNVLLTEIKQEGGTPSWARDYIYAGSRLIASVRAVRTSVTLKVAKLGGGVGVVSASPGGIACGTTCEASVPVGGAVTLTAASEAGSQFAGWGGACRGTQTTTTMTAGEDDVTCTARFIVPTVLTIQHDGTGTGSVTVTDGATEQVTIACAVGACTGTFDRGTPVTLQASAPDGFAFVGWSGDCSGVAPTLEFALTSGRTCTARFVPLWWLTVVRTGAQAAVSPVSTSPTGMYVRYESGNYRAQYPEGAGVTLAVQPPTGVTFLGWSGDGCGTGVVLMDRPRTCTAAFTVIISKTQPANGATGVSLSGALSWTGSAVPNAGYRVCWDTTNNLTCDHPNGWMPNGSGTTKTLGDLPPSLQLLPGTTYYWQAEVETPDAVLTPANGGAWWSFTTAGSVLPPVTIVSLTANQTFPLPAETPVAWTVVTSGGQAPLEYRFERFDATTGVWTTPQVYGPSPTFTWTPTPAQAGSYRLRVTVRTAGVSGAPETAQETTTFAITTILPQITALTATPAMPGHVGVPVTWTVEARGGRAPLQYRFWRYDDATDLWTIVQDYGPSHTWTWTPTAADQGHHWLQVWVRNAGSTADFDAWAGTGWYTIGAARPLSVTAVADVAGPAVGQALTIAATPDGGSGPLQYKFYRYQVTTGAWTVMRDYGPGRTLTWIPTAAEAATYHFQVWVRNVGSTAAYDAWVNTADFVVGAARPLTVTGVTRSAAQVGAGMAVRFTATTDGGSGPLQFKFRRYSVAQGTWQTVQDYGASASWTWQTGEPDLGSYTLEVWVRNAGSTAAYDASAAMATFTVGAPRGLVVTRVAADVSGPAAGMTMTWTAETDGGYGALEYAYFRYDSSTGLWVLAQSYGPSPSHTWTPGAADVGTHLLQVWVRQVGSTVAWDAWLNFGDVVIGP